MFSLLLLIVCSIYLFDLVSLFSTPVPDSYLWWGDESWLMIEFRNQMLHGVFRHPYALASSLQQGSGIIFGSMWVPALVYGIPSALIGPEKMDIVLLGRTITAVVSITLVMVLYELVRKMTFDRLLAIFSVLLLITSRSFLLVSHSARYDMLSALAILIGTYLLLRMRTPSIWHAALIGALTAATLLVTVHVTIALTIAAFVALLFYSGTRRLLSMAAFALGFIVVVLAIVGIAALTRQTTALGTPGAFAMNLRDIPILRFYSRSVQTANLLQRWNMFGAFALGYLYVWGLLALIAVYRAFQSRRISFPITSAIVVLVVFSWLEFESAAPSSYLIYLLPILSLAAAMAFKNVLSEPLRVGMVLVVGMALAVFAFRDMPSRHGKGYVISQSNSLAIAAALGEMEPQRDNSIPNDTPFVHPIVLSFTPAVHELLRDTDVRLMTTQFVEYPATNMSVDSVLRYEHVDYVLLYASTRKPEYMREVEPIRGALDRMATPLWERAGFFTDIGRSYFDTVLSEPDTLRLYRINAP